MPERDPEQAPRFLILLATLIITLVAIAARCQVSAQQGGLSDQLALARVCASEIGLTGAPEECAAIADVLRDRAMRNHWTFVSAARRYSSRVFDRSRTDSRGWVAALDPAGRRPPLWPRSVAWDTYGQPRWSELYEAAGRIVAGEIVSMCDMQISHWGCRRCGDQHRARRAGWMMVDCFVPRDCTDGETPHSDYGVCTAPTRNGFWVVPALLADVD